MKFPEICDRNKRGISEWESVCRVEEHRVGVQEEAIQLCLWFTICCAEKGCKGLIFQEGRSYGESLIVPLHLTLKIQSDSFYWYLSFYERKPILQAC